jgi:site-specific DNA recombinase
VLDLQRQGIVTKCSLRRDGRIRGGVPFRKGALAYLLRNRVYVGDVVHKGRYFAGEHEPIVPRDLFDAVQHRLDAQANSEGGVRLNTDSPLTGKLFDDRGNRMTPSTTNKAGVRYRYYVSSALTEGRKGEAGAFSRVPAVELEAAIRAALNERPRERPNWSVPNGDTSGGWPRPTRLVKAKPRRGAAPPCR